MKNFVLVFPGQGSQYVGMGKDLNSERFEIANSTLDLDLKNLCFNGPEEDLKLTANTQPAIITHSIALLDELFKYISKDQVFCTLGHSVGEYAALVCSGALDFEMAIKAVRKRGQLMQESVPVGVGGMAAYLRIEAEKVREACEAVTQENDNLFVSVANYNDPNQTVISGHLDALAKVENYLKNKDEKFRAIPLPVSAPFHCQLVEKAESGLEEYFKNPENGVSFKKLEIPYIANIDSKQYDPDALPSQIRTNLIKQVTGSVLWLQSVKTLPENVVIVEVGPGKVLKGLVKKIRPDLEVFSLDKDGFDFLKS